MFPSRRDDGGLKPLSRRAGALIVGVALALAIAGVGLSPSRDTAPVASVAGYPVLPPSGMSDQIPPPSQPARGGGEKAKDCLDSKRIAEARRWAADRTGEVSFAVLDECKRLVGAHRYRTHYSASVVKVMLMVAYLRRDDVRDRDLTDDERAMLGPMITVSDNDRANQVYAIVGPDGLYEVADAAKMRVFSTMPAWGGSEISAGDQASFVGRIERFIPKRHEDYALGLMADVIDSQRWGVPRLGLPGWNVHLKGGWSPQASGGGWRVNQIALLRRHDRRFSLAILSSDQPDYGYGQATIEGVAKRLLRPYFAESEKRAASR